MFSAFFDTARSGEWKKDVGRASHWRFPFARNWRSESHRRGEVRDAPDSLCARSVRSNNRAARHEKTPSSIPKRGSQIGGIPPNFEGLKYAEFRAFGTDFSGVYD